MPIPNSILAQWSHHPAATASVQAHTSIRDALANYKGWSKENKYGIFLQGSYKNDTNLRHDSDVDVVVQLEVRLRPLLAALNGEQLEGSDAHKVAHERWQSFRNQVLKALRAKFGTEAVTSGRKSLKLATGKIPAAADVVVTLHCENGLAFYIPDEHRWAVSYPQQHYAKGVKKERGTSGTYKQTIRMFKTARNHLVENYALGNGTATSYFIECLLYNVPDGLFRQGFGQTYIEVVSWLCAADLRQFKSQDGVRDLFGPSNDQWSVNNARRFVLALSRLWKKWL